MDVWWLIVSKAQSNEGAQRELLIKVGVKQ